MNAPFSHFHDQAQAAETPARPRAAGAARAAQPLAAGLVSIKTSDTWAAAGSVDTDLSFLSFLELYGTEIAERRMPARRVIEALDVVEHI